MVMHRKVIVLPGIAIEYSGPGSVVERLNSSRPISVDLILEVILLIVKILSKIKLIKIILNSFYQLVILCHRK